MTRPCKRCHARFTPPRGEHKRLVPWSSFYGDGTYCSMECYNAARPRPARPVSRFAERNRLIVAQRARGVTYAKIAREQGLSLERIRQIVARADRWRLATEVSEE